MGYHKDVDVEDVKPLLADPTALATVHRLNVNLLPIFLAMATLCYLDRTNLAFASLQLNKDLGFTPEVYGLGSGLFFVGYSLSMIPSQLILMRVGAPRWLGILVTTWGLTAMSFAFIRSKTQFYVLRMVLGVAESGAFPGMWYYLNSFYPPERITLPYSLIEAAVGVANVMGAPLAAGLLLLDGWKGLRGWQWLFFLEGLPSVCLGLAMAYRLPRDFQSAPFLSTTEKSWLAHAMSTVKKHSSEAEARGATRLLGDALRNRRIYVVGLTAVLKNAAMVGVLFWAPLLVDALIEGSSSVDVAAAGAAGVGKTGGASVSSGHGPAAGGGSKPPREISAVLLTSIPFITAAGCAVWLGHRSEARGEKCYHVAVPFALAGLLFLCFPYTAHLSSKAAFLCLTLAITALTAPNAIVNSMASSLGQGPAQALSLAVYNAIGNLGGLLGPFMVGKLVQATGVYSLAMQFLGVLVLGASGVCTYMKRWNL